MQNSSLEFHKQTPDGFIRFGSLSGVFGFKGEAKFFLYNRKTDLFGKWLTVYEWIAKDKEVGRAIEVKLRKGSGKKVVGQVRIDGTLLQHERDIRPMMGTELLLAESQLPSLSEDEFYHHQLLGLSVEYPSGAKVGTLIEITQGVVDVFTVRLLDSKEVLYVPHTKEHVLDTTAERMVIRQYAESNSDQ